MNSRIIVAGLVVALSPLSLPSTSLAADTAPRKEITAQDLAKEPVSATFEFEATSVRLLVGGSSGKGVLRFQGKDYPFTAKSLSAGGVGVAEVHAVGEVRYLKRIEDFAGKYGGATAGITAVKGKGAATFENSKGVVVSVKQKSDGLMLGLGISGFEVTLTK